MPPLLQFSIPSRLRWQAWLLPPRPTFCASACLRPEHRHLLLCHLLAATDRSSEAQSREASGSLAFGLPPLPLAIWFCGKPHWPHASSSPWPHPCPLTCLSKEEAPEHLLPRRPRACAALAMGIVLAVASSLVLLLFFSACRPASGLLSPKGVNYEGAYSLPKSRDILVILCLFSNLLQWCLQSPL